MMESVLYLVFGLIFGITIGSVITYLMAKDMTEDMLSSIFCKLMESYKKDKDIILQDIEDIVRILYRHSSLIECKISGKEMKKFTDQELIETKIINDGIREILEKIISIIEPGKKEIDSLIKKIE